MYFLKQYKGAVEAYEDALYFENEDGNGGNSAITVTRAYLQKAMEKLAKQEEKERRKQERANGTTGVDDSTLAGEESVNPSVVYSIATDKDRVGLASGMQAQNKRVHSVADAPLDSRSRIYQPPLQGLSIKEDDPNENQVTEKTPPGSPFQSLYDPVQNSRSSPLPLTVETGPMGGPAQRRVESPTSQPQDARAVASPSLNLPTPKASPANDSAKIDTNEPDPDFEEALRLQRRATHFLTTKKYTIAVDEFSAALFLVPDDPILTPQLHVGRAHALNGQERFESAKNDALMALKHILRDREEDVSAAEAYSVLGKSLYYSKDYQASIEALEESERILKKYGGKLNVFDEAYLEQCREALDAGLGVDHDDGLSLGGGKSVMSSGVKSVVTCIKEGKSISNIPKLKPPRFVPREKVSDFMIVFRWTIGLPGFSASCAANNSTKF